MTMLSHLLEANTARNCGNKYNDSFSTLGEQYNPFANSRGICFHIRSTLIRTVRTRILVPDICHTFNIPHIPHICCPCQIHRAGHCCLLPLFDKCISHITNRVQGCASFYRQAISHGCKGHPFNSTELIFLSPHKSNIFEWVI